MSNTTGFETTKEDLRRIEHDESNFHPGGNIPKGSTAAAAQVSKQSSSMPLVSILT